MPTVGNKHAGAEQFFYPGFDGGINLSVPPESLPRNELREALNFEFCPGRGSMKVRGGLVKILDFDARVLDWAPVPGKVGFLVRLIDNRVFYFRRNLLWEVRGKINGDGPLTAAAWEKPGQMLLATGGRLQMFDEYGFGGVPRVEDLPESPESCRHVFVRDGRVGVVDGTDTIRFSWVGDCRLWENDPDDEQTGQFVEIGYKDGMEIDAVVPLSRDLIVFKSPNKEPSKGTVYRLVGEFPDWQVLEAAHNTGTFGPRCVLAVGNDVYYASPDGLASLAGVTAYGDIRATWPDRKVATVLTATLGKDTVLWNVPEKEQLWVLPARTGYEPMDPSLPVPEGLRMAGRVWVFMPSRGIWTQFGFPGMPDTAGGFEGMTYLVLGQTLYQLNDAFHRDLLADGLSEIEARLVLGTVIRASQVLIKRALATFQAAQGAYAELRLRGFRLPLTGGGSEPEYIATDDDIAFLDDDPLAPGSGGVLTARQRCVVRDWALAPEVRTRGGGFEITSLGLEVVEV